MPALKDRSHQIPGGFQFELPAFGWKSASFSSFDSIVSQVHAVLNANPSVARARNLPLEREAIANWVDRENAKLCEANGWLDYFIASPELPVPAQRMEQWPLWARTVAALKQEGESGVGDTIERLIGRHNSIEFKVWYKNTFGRDCGCSGRKEQYNRKYGYLSTILTLAIGIMELGIMELGAIPPLPPVPTNRLHSSVSPLPPSGQVTVAWSYPSNQLSDDMSFVIEATNQLAALPWFPVANPTASNCLTGFDGTNFRFATQFQIQPGQMYFTCYASNFWGLSTTSNVTSTPPLPIEVWPVSITRTN